MKTILLLLASVTLAFAQLPYDSLSKENVAMKVDVTKTSNNGPRELKISLSPIGNIPQPTSIEIYRQIRNKKEQKEIVKAVIPSDTGAGEFTFAFPELRKWEKHLDWMVQVVRNGRVVAVFSTGSTDKFVSK